MNNGFFMRTESKYLITRHQRAVILNAIRDRMRLDSYGHSLIRNIYFDTPSFRLIRRSLEKPIYKEKMRIRAYGDFSPSETVYVELKKKYKGIVYKRREAMPYPDALCWTTAGGAPPRDTQIAREIDYFMHFYEELAPMAYLSYEREAYCMTDGGDFRLTLDENIRARFHDVSLDGGDAGESVLDGGLVLLELKCNEGIPLWLTHLLSREKIFKTSFSKYGVAYLKQICGRSPVTINI